MTCEFCDLEYLTLSTHSAFLLPVEVVDWVPTVENAAVDLGVTVTL